MIQLIYLVLLSVTTAVALSLSMAIQTSSKMKLAKISRLIGGTFLSSDEGLAQAE